MRDTLAPMSLPPSRKSPELTDDIQEACILRMIHLGLNPVAVADLVEPGKVDADHVVKYLTRRAPMTSHKLQHIFRVLGLGALPVNPSA